MYNDPRHLPSDLLTGADSQHLPLNTVFEQLANAGVAVYCFDVHGHGQSEPLEPRVRGWVQKWTHLVSLAAADSVSTGAIARLDQPMCFASTVRSSKHR